MKRSRTIKRTKSKNKKQKLHRRRRTHKGGMVPAARQGAVVVSKAGTALASIFGRAFSTVPGPPNPAPTALDPVATPGPAAAPSLASAPVGAFGVPPVVSASRGIAFLPSSATAPSTSGIVRGARAAGPGTRVGDLSRVPLPAQGPRAPARPGNRYTEDEIKDLTPKEIRALLEEVGSSRTFPSGTRATTMLPVLREALIAADRIHVVPAATRNAQRAALNQTIPRTPPEFATPVNIQTPTPIGDKVRTSAESLAAQNGGVSAGDADRLFGQATQDAQALVDEVIPLNGRNLLGPIEEQGGQTAAQAVRLLPELPAGEGPTAAEIETILDSIFPARVLGRELELGPQNLARQRGVQRGVMPQRNVNAYNEQIRELVSVVLVHTPGAQVRQFTEVFTPQRLTRLKASLGAYFLRNPLDARLILDELFSILPRAKYNGAILDNLITNLAAQPERALAELVRASSAIQGAALEAGQIQALTFAKGMGWFAARGFYTLLAAGLGVLGLFIAAWTNINSTEDLAREIRINREIFDARFPGVAEFRDRAALFFQGAAAAIMDSLYELRGIPRPLPAPAPAPAPAGPPAVVRPSPEVWAWARYIGEYARMLRDLHDVVLGRRGQ